MADKKELFSNDTGITLDEVLINLQKTFSRVVRDTIRHKESHPAGERAIMIDPINFEIEINVAVDLESKDQFKYDPNGDIRISLNGRIDPDFDKERT